MRYLFFFVLIQIPFVADALAQGVRELTRPCRVERLDIAYGHCVDLMSDQREIAMAAAIGQTLSTLQAATGPELRALADRYESSQQTWRKAVAAACTTSFPDAVRAQADCRLGAVIARQEQLSLSLGRAADDLGGQIPLPGFDAPDSVEVFVPLPGVPNGPDQSIRVPLIVPIQP